MTTHIMSFTYRPKIERVWSGEITQTIRGVRPGSRPKKIGDRILFHTWTGRPYRSKWGRRLSVEIIDLHDIRVFHWGIINQHGMGMTWNAPGMDKLAELDGIEPPTGNELGRVLLNINRSKEGATYQIITWKPVEYMNNPITGKKYPMRDPEIHHVHSLWDYDRIQGEEAE